DWITGRRGEAWNRTNSPTCADPTIGPAIHINSTPRMNRDRRITSPLSLLIVAIGLLIGFPTIRTAATVLTTVIVGGMTTNDPNRTLRPEMPGGAPALPDRPAGPLGPTVLEPLVQPSRFHQLLAQKGGKPPVSGPFSSPPDGGGVWNFGHKMWADGTFPRRRHAM